MEDETGTLIGLALILAAGLYHGAPREVREALAIGQPGAHDWAIPVALLRGVRGSPRRR